MRCGNESVIQCTAIRRGLEGDHRTLSGSEIDRIEVSTFTIPTDFPESDGTLEWNSTTLVLVHAYGGGRVGLGYTYADTATATLIQDLLSEAVKGRDAMAPAASWNAMVSRIRNLGRPGIASMALSAVDIALWDLKARLLNVPLLTLLGAVRNSVPIYGSGGFTSYSDRQLQMQLAGWVEQGITRVKMKIGRDARADARRVREARTAVGAETELFVDANGAYSRKQALEQAERFGNMVFRGMGYSSVRLGSYHAINILLDGKVPQTVAVSNAEQHSLGYYISSAPGAQWKKDTGSGEMEESQALQSALKM